MNKHATGQPKVGLALGSGSARGLAHIGVIRALKEAGIQVDCVAGTSVGAMIGAVYASGKIDSLQNAYMAMDWKKILYFLDVVFPKSGIIDGKKVADFTREYIRSASIEDLPLPYKAVATELNSGEEVVFETGDVIDAVRASISVPGMFTPVRVNGRVLVDGGLVNPVPVSVVQSMGADIVIAVDLNHDIVTGKVPKQALHAPSKPMDDGAFIQALSRMGGGNYLAAMERINQGLQQSLDTPALNHIRAWLEEEPLPNIFEVLLSSINIMESQITRGQLRMNPPNILIRPPLGHIRFLEFNRAEEIISIGYEAAQQQIDLLSSDYFNKMQSSISSTLVDAS